MVDIDIRQLEYFVGAACSGSYAAAARRLFVSPQAVSKGIASLERSWGCSLFERGPKGIALSAHGVELLDQAKLTLASVKRLDDMARARAGASCGVLHAGIHSLCFKEHGGTIDWGDLSAFHERHEGCESSFVELRGDSVVSQLDDGSIGVGVGVVPDERAADFDTVFLKSFPLGVIASCEAAHIVGRGSATVQDLAHGRIALFPEESAINGFLALRAREEGLVLKASPLQTRAYEDVGFVHDETTYMVRPYQHAVRTVKDDGVSIVGLVDGEGRAVEVELRVFWRKDVGLSALEREFVGMVMRLYGAGGRADACSRRGDAAAAGAGRRAPG